MAWNFRALKGTMEKASPLSSLVTWGTKAPRRKGLDLGHTTEAGYARRKSSLSCYVLLCFSTCLPPFLPPCFPSMYLSIHPCRQTSIFPPFMPPSLHLSNLHLSIYPLHIHPSNILPPTYQHVHPSHRWQPED